MSHKKAIKARSCRAIRAFMVGASICFVVALAACGSSTTASQGTEAQTPSEAYMMTSYAITRADGSMLNDTYEFDNKGKVLSERVESNAEGENFIYELTSKEWDDFGHSLKDD